MEYNLRKLIKIIPKILKRSWIIAICALLGFGVGVLMTMRMEPDAYSANVTLYSTASTSYQDMLQGRSIMRDYTDILRSTKLANRTASKLNNELISPDLIKSIVRSSVVEGSAIFTISVRHTNRQICVDVANTIADEFLAELRAVTGLENMNILDYATSAMQTSSGRTQQVQTRLLAILIGVFLSTALIVLVELYTSKVITLEDASLNNEVLILGVIPDNNI